MATSPQPTASVDAEPVAFLYVDDDGNAAFEHSRSGCYPYWTETPLYTEAQMQARADAARDRLVDRIAALEAKLAEKDALLRECGEMLRKNREGWLNVVEMDLLPHRHFTSARLLADDNATTLAAILRALKENSRD